MFSSQGKISSKKVFRDIDKANAYIADFKAICTLSDKKEDLIGLGKVDKVVIVELELVE